MNFTKTFAIAFALMMLISVAAVAQTTSNLTGTVVLGGNPIPGVTVTIASPSLQGVRTTNSDVNGNYNFGNIPPGEYTVKFEMEGMQSVTRNAHVTLSGTARADAELKVSAVSEAITVTAGAPAVMETTEVQTNLQQKVINDLPIGRTITAAVSLAPGISTSTGSAETAAGAITISGAPSNENVVMINGAQINENLRGQPRNLFVEDAIQETTVLQGGAISAEFGRFTGGVINTITKSGGNQFSGSIRDTLNNDKWTSLNSKFYSVTGSAPRTRTDKINSIYESTLGGRIIKDRLWFFLSGRENKLSSSTVLSDNSGTQLPSTTRNTRWEAKLTGQINDKNTLVGSYFKVRTDQTNFCFIACEEISNIDTDPNFPEDFRALHYNGIITSNLLIEGNYSKRRLGFVGEGGSARDFANGSYILDGLSGQFAGNPVFCGVCDPENRNNNLYGAKATYYLATKGLGTQSIVAGYERFAETRHANNYQAGSNFAVYIYNDNVPANCVNGICHPTITPDPGDGSGDQVKFTPILQLTQGDNFRTESLFLNDKWDLNSHLNLNIGVRYDKNHGVNSSGQLVANDSNISPRLGAIYDVRGDGKYRIDASYSKYVTRIAETIAGGTAGGGNPAYLYYLYTGPVINANHTLNSQQALAQVYQWLVSVGGCNGQGVGGCSNGPVNLPLGGNASAVPGVASSILGSLKSPNVDEVTLGFGSQLTQNAFFRIDGVHRKWRDFYTQVINSTTGVINANFNGSPLPPLDKAVFTNDNSDYKRTYDAVNVQAAVRPWSTTNVGIAYTYSKLRGNVLQESAGSGPLAQAVTAYPEYKAFAGNDPVGYLGADQRHKFRAWGSYRLPTRIGGFDFSVLERFDSGTPYSAVGSISVASFAKFVTLPAGFAGYQATPSTVAYYFGGRGAYRFDNTTSTDLGVTYEIPVSRFSLFVQAKMLNTFNEQGQIAGNTTDVRVGSRCKSVIGVSCAAFNPFSDTPVQGVNYVLGPNFGKPTKPTTTGGIAFNAINGSYQLPRTYYFSFGGRF